MSDGFPMRPYVERPATPTPRADARFVLAPPYVLGRIAAIPERKLPSIDEFLDHVPSIEQFAPAADAVEGRESEWGWGGEAASAPEAKTGWAGDDLQGYDWGGAARLGAAPPDAAAKEWASTDWSEPGGSQQSRQSAADALAHALDQIARRIRAGELRLPGADTVRDDTAIAATLAALLGIKR